MSERPTIIVVAPDPSKLPQTLSSHERLGEVCDLIFLRSIDEITMFIDSNLGANTPVIVLDYVGATQGIGGADITSASRQGEIIALKNHGLRHGRKPRTIIGVSGLYGEQMRGIGCDTVVSTDDLPALIINQFTSTTLS